MQPVNTDATGYATSHYNMAVRINQIMAGAKHCAKNNIQYYKEALKQVVSKQVFTKYLSVLLVL